jgi:hypothetical protein
MIMGRSGFVRVCSPLVGQAEQLTHYAATLVVGLLDHALARQSRSGDGSRTAGRTVRSAPIPPAHLRVDDNGCVENVNRNLDAVPVHPLKE